MKNENVYTQFYRDVLGTQVRGVTQDSTNLP